jgi:hypothetical protein
MSFQTLVRDGVSNDELCAPASVIEHAKFSRGVDPSRLADPRQRFPNYRAVDAIDWLEDVHDHSGGLAHHEAERSGIH